MTYEKFSDADIELFRARAVSDPSALITVVMRLREITELDGHSFGAVRLAAEALRSLGANVPPTRSEILLARRRPSGHKGI